MLEQQMQELSDLPARVGRVESQILQLRQEIGVEFSAVRTEMHQIREELREDIRIGVEESQNLAKLLVAQVSAELRDQVVARLDRLLEIQRPSEPGT